MVNTDIIHKSDINCNCGISLLHPLCGYEIPPDANTDSKKLFFLTDKCYSPKAGSLKEELIKRASTDHLNFKENNNMLYKLFDSSLKTTTFHSTLQPFEETEDGQGT